MASQSNDTRVMSKISYPKRLFLLCGFALLLYILFYHWLQIKDNTYQPYYWAPDADSYLNASKNLYAHGTVDPNRPYGFPLLIGLPTFLGFGIQTELFSHFLNIAFWIASIITTYLTVFVLVKNKRVAFAGAIFFLTIIGLPAINNQVLTEPACGFFIILSGYQLAKFLRKNEKKYLVFMLIALGAGALIKPILYPFTVSLIVGCFIFFLLKKEHLLAVSVLIPLLLLSVQIIGNGLQHNSFQFSNIGGYTYFNYLGAYAVGTSCTLELNQDAARWEAARENRLLEIPKDENAKVIFEAYNRKIRDDLLFQLTENTWPLFYSYIRNVASNATSPSGFVCNLRNIKSQYIFEPLRQVLCILSRIQNSVLSFIGLTTFSIIFFVKKIKGEDRPLLWWLVASGGLTAYFILVTGISFAQGDRLHLPLFGLALLQFIVALKLLLPSEFPWTNVN